MALKIRERDGLRKVGHTTMASHNIFPLGCRWLKISSSASMATISAIPNGMSAIRPKSAGGHQGVVWIQSFPLLGHRFTPARDRQGLALSGRYMPGSLVRGCYWLFAANLYMCIHMHTHVHIHAYTYIQIHIYKSIDKIINQVYWSLNYDNELSVTNNSSISNSI